LGSPSPNSAPSLPRTSPVPLDDGEQRKLLAAKLDQIEDKRRQFGQMAEFLRAKLEDLEL
jgi:hypothetical protein